METAKAIEGETEMTIHYTHKEWNAMPTDRALRIFNDAYAVVSINRAGVTVTKV